MRGEGAASDLERDLAPIIALAEKPVTTAAELTANLRAIYSAVLGFDLERYRHGDVAGAQGLMKKAFDARARLRNRLAEWAERGLLTRESVTALRDVFRIARYGIDLLGETAIGNAKLAPGEKTLRAFTGRDHNTFVNPRFDTGANLPFRSGDVILIRGTAHNSAAIARIGDVDSQFSHICMVYIDGEGRHWVVESLIEDGATINTLEHALDHGVRRAVLYRCKDAELAERAAALIHARVNASLTGKTRRIPYDFSMRLKGKRKLFCSKLVRRAFEEASAGKVLLPAFRTRLDMRNKDFFRRIGVAASETFAPGDIDVDPAFDLIAEWQDYRITSKLRAKDMIMDKVFEWMEVHGMRFRESFLVRLMSWFGRFASYLSNDVKELLADVIPKIPGNMRRRTIAAVVMLHKTGEALLASIVALEEDHIRMTGFPLPPAHILDHLERLREVSGGRIGYLQGPA